MAADGLLTTGQTALREGRWADAVVAFTAALEHEDTAEANVGLADAYWWSCEARASARHRERAWSLLRHAGDAVGAGRVAIDLCIAHLVNLGNDAAARGWLARAGRAVSGLDPNPLQGWLWLMQGYMAPGPHEGHGLTRAALELAQRTGDSDLELVALSDLGLGMVVAGSVDEGMALLDEAMAATLAGEYRRLDTVVFATCNMLAACHHCGDLDRAGKWCRAADEFMASYGCPFLYARCRVHYGGVLVASGLWADAEEHFRAAIEMSADAGPGARMEAVAQLADLRLRQGRIEEAEALLHLIEETSDTTLAAAALRMARGDVEVAGVMLERRARALGDHHVETPPTIALLVDAQLAAGSFEAARASAARLRSLAELQGRDAAHALAGVAAARVATADGRDDEAVAALEDALSRFTSGNLLLDAARVRLDLARLRASRSVATAVADGRQALATFERLGATAEADAARALLRSLGAAGRAAGGGAGAGRSAGVLTHRETEVLRLVAVGLSNPEIGRRLYISRKTASNHVSSVLAKLGLRNRAEAAAYATSHGL